MMQGIWWTYLVANPLGHMLGVAILCHTERFKWLYVKPRDTSLYLNYTPKNPFPYKKIGWAPVLSSLHRILSHQEPPSHCWWKKSSWYKESQTFAKVKAGYLSSRAEPRFGDNYVLDSIGKSRKYEMVVPLHSLLDLHSFTKPRI